MSKLLIVVSNKMDTNKKPDRDENVLIRLPKKSRENVKLPSVNFGDNKPELKVFEAFSHDIKSVIDEGICDKNSLKNVAFVTSDTFKKIFPNSKGKHGEIEYSKEASTEVININIGADPEFLLFNAKGNVIRANNVMGKGGQIGSDGAMAEVRPMPSNNPLIVTNNIKDIFLDKDLTNPIIDLKWKASVYFKDVQRDYPVGGHIHLGNTKFVDGIQMSNRSILFSVLNKILDELLALPMIKIDGKDEGKNRRSNCQMALGNQGYGYYGEWRLCSGRLEHRTLSGMWLMHPTLAESVLSAAKVIIEEAHRFLLNGGYNNKLFTHPEVNVNNYKVVYNEEFDGWGAIPVAKELGCVRSSSYMKNVLNNSNSSSINAKFLKKWYENIRKMSGYKKHSKQIDALYEILSMPRRELIKVGTDIKENWSTDKKLL
jgi:hypothetical protein